MNIYNYQPIIRKSNSVLVIIVYGNMKQFYYILNVYFYSLLNTAIYFYYVV